ncbi:MAG TPA: SurA N-terminal domain-containing protein [Desulfosalsimonadaceae bacterium]|nr:SurA N-terminal domain-containing protein [Desulfosalsimonadaceae bacterium]
MLNKMRESASSWMIKILLGIIVLAFVFMGVGSFNSGRTTKAASVNGEPVSIREYQQTYQRIIDRLRQQFGDRFNNDMLEMFNVKQQAMNQVIETELLRQTARKYKLKVAPSELAETITSIPAFKKNGQFNQQQYKMVLNQNRLSPESFEALQRESMLIQKLRSIVASGIQVSPAEARQWYNWKNAEIKIDYALFKPSDFSDVAVDEEAVKAHYEAHKEQYKTQPQVKTRYVKFAPEDYLSKVDVSETDIKAYYNNNQKKYQQPATVHARHILLKLNKGASPEEVAKRREKAMEIMKKAKAEKDFSELAAEYSEGPSKEKGGDLGTFERGDMVKPFSDKAFSMEPGEISEPVRTQFGWHIIKVEEKTEKGVKPIAEVKDQIRQTLAMEKAKNEVYDDAVSMYNISFTGDDLVKNTQDREDLSVETTDFFTQQKGPAGVSKPKAFAEAAFKLPKMDVSDVKELGNAFFLIQVLEKKEAQIPEFETVREEVIADWKKQEQRKASENAAKEFLASVKSANSIQSAAEDAGIEINTTDFFSRNQSIPEIGRDQAMVGAAFNLSAAEPLPESPIDGRKGFYVIAFSNKQLPDPEDFEKEKDQVVKELMNQKKTRYMDAWIAQLREKSEIEISEQIIN